jgi:hypothetical protein
MHLARSDTDKRLKLFWKWDAVIRDSAAYSFCGRSRIFFYRSNSVDIHYLTKRGFSFQGRVSAQIKLTAIGSPESSAWKTGHRED